jgi:lipopolysaccharide transport system ATP-binding protein
MNDIAIHVEGLGKQYRIGSRKPERYVTLRDSLVSALAAPFRQASRLLYGQPRSTVERDATIWALKDVSFDVARGEVIGIIGRNGAGKSTLLKILSRITEPTEGYAEIHGRVGSLLEVGTGFHPELTGRENVYLNGAILGMRRAEIERKFDEIVAFAEIEKFIDTPVKYYSSGMYVRLAFSVAAHMEPEILLVDEVLAVGDVAFQQMCLGRMGEVAKSGRTVLFVSHNMAAVRKLCGKAMLLDEGRVVTLGKTAGVLQRYLDGRPTGQSQYKISPPEDNNVPGWAHTLTVENIDGTPVVGIPVGRPWQVRIQFTITRRIEHFMVGLGLSSNDDTAVRASWSVPSTLEPGEYQAVFREDLILLGSGRYPISVGLSSFERAFHYVDPAGFLEIAEFTEDVDLVRSTGTGVTLNPMTIEIVKLDS